MDTRLIFLSLSFLIAKGVFGDEVKSVSVMEGHSVTLHTDIIKHKDDKIMWYYGSENTFVARMNGDASSTMLSDDERFRDKLKLNDQTGDLTITDITSQHSGLYTLKISSNNKVSYKKFSVTVNGVFTGEVKSVSVREGHSVTLNTNITELQTDVEIEWRFGHKSTFVAVINEKAGITRLSTDERFRDRVKRDYQTGDLSITHITTDHSGIYHLKISNNNNVLYQKFDVTVYGVFTGDEVKSVSVREGHSVILYTHVLKQRDDLMEWRFGPENTFVSKTNGKINTSRLSSDERFRDRVKRDDQTGALTISDITTHHSGLYQLRIYNNNTVSYKGFNVTVYDEVSVREGHYVTLYTHVLKQRDDVMVWYYGSENTVVAVINGKAGTSRLSTEERFRDRVKLDDQTGDLMISDITTHHSGLYQLRINSNNTILNKKFYVTIHAHLPIPVISQQNSSSSERCSSCSDSRVLWVWVIPVALLICVCVCVGFCVQKHRADPMKTLHALTDDGSSINSSNMLNADASRFSSSNNVNTINTEDEKKMQENLI